MAKRLIDVIKGMVPSYNPTELTPEEKAQVASAELLGKKTNFQNLPIDLTGLANDEELTIRQRQYPGIRNLISR